MGHDWLQWEPQRGLPNPLYTNGTEWRLYLRSELAAGPVALAGDLATAGRSLETPAGLERLLTEFLRWKPQPITAVGALVRTVAPLTRLLRGEMLDQVTAERKAVAAGILTLSWAAARPEAGPPQGEIQRTQPNGDLIRPGPTRCGDAASNSTRASIESRRYSA
jgi:hypothetical protein